MSNKMVWLTTSLFYSKSKWHRIFADCVVPFVTENDFIEAYSIELNHSIGNENIKISLLSVAEKEPQLKKQAEAYFKNWFLKANTLDLKDAALGKESSLSHKANIAQFELSKPDKNINEKECLAFSTGLSKTILDSLMDDVVDDETILTLTFYLQIGLIKAAKEIDPGFMNILMQLARPPRSVHRESFKTGNTSAGNLILSEIIEQESDSAMFIMDRIDINAKFEDNKENLLEITNDIMSDAMHGDIPPWMGRWLRVCKNEINKMVKSEGIGAAYSRIIEIVYRHLGVTPEMNATLSYFIERIFGFINPPDAIIIGAQKCGTTTLHHTLITHSNIKGPVIPGYNRAKKEINFFYNGDKWKQGVDWYFSHFVGSKDIFLDSSPNYLTSKFCFKQMNRIVPQAKLIICIRNPVYRAYSQYNHYKQILPKSEKWDWIYGQDFLTNVKTELDRIEMSLQDDNNYLNSGVEFTGLLLRGVYINQINELLNYYNRSQIYITITDLWPQNFKSELDNIQTFLGLEKELITLKIENKRDYKVEPFSNEAKELLTEFYKPYNKKLFEFLGFEIPGWG